MALALSMPVNTPRLHTALLVAAALAVSLSACGPSWLQVRNVPENGFAKTLNYQFQAKVHADSLGRCEMMVVRVKPLNKMYSGDEPPSRLQLFDDDCMSPVRFERVQYISNETGEQVQLSGPQITRFLSSYVRLENELMEWLWREGII